MLCEAKLAYDKVLQAGKLNADELKLCENQLAVCEGSDWFWWLGDYNAAASISSFDQLYRRNLSNLYSLLKLTAPASLSLPISTDMAQQLNDNTGADNAGADKVGTMKRGKES